MPWLVWLSGLDAHAADRKLVGLIPSRVPRLGCGFGCRRGHARGKRLTFHSHVAVSLPLLSFPSSFPKKSISPQVRVKNNL